MLIGAGFLIVIFMSVGPVSLQSSISDISTQSSLYLLLTTNQKQYFKISGHYAFKSLFLRLGSNTYLTFSLNQNDTTDFILQFSQSSKSLVLTVSFEGVVTLR